MSKFCTNCGTNTDENNCECVSTVQPEVETIIADETTNTVSDETATPQIPNINFDPEKAAAAMNTAKDTAASGFSLAKSIFTDMIGNIHKDPSKENTNLRLVIGGGHLLTVLLLSFFAINYVTTMFLGDFASMISIPFSSTISIALFLIVVTALYMVIPAGICFVASKKYLPEQSFLDVLGVFSICTIPTTILYVLAAVASFMNLELATYFVCIATVTYLIHCYEAVISTTRQNRNSALVVLLVIISITAVVQYFVINAGSDMLVNQLQNAMMNSFSW